MKEINEIKRIIHEKKLSLNYTEYNVFNPMRLFYDKTREKEICHSKIIADLLSPKGKHGTGDSFIKEFFSLIGINFPQESEIRISREKDVKRQLTKGAGERKIDIFIEWEDNCQKKGVIIENKLNNAKYQELQIEDYRESLKGENYEIIKTMILSDNIELCEKEGCTYWYNKEIANWIESTMKKNLENREKLNSLYSYIYILKQKAYKSDINMDAEKLLELNDTDLAIIKKLVDCYNNSFINAVINDAKKEIGQSINCPDNSKECELTYRTTKGNVLQIWNDKAYHVNKLWVEIWFYNRQPGEELYDQNAEIWIASDNNKTVELKEICSYFSDYKQDDNDNKYYSSTDEDKFSYNYLVKESRVKMYKEVCKILEKISSYHSSLK